MEKRVFQEIAVGILIVGGVLVFIFLAIKVGGAGLGRKNIYIIPAKDVLGLVENSSVMIAGVEIGRVRDLSVCKRHALITIAVNGKIKLHRGTRFYIRGKSLLGEKYLDVMPGPETAPLLSQNKVLSTWATHETEIGDFVTKIDNGYMPTTAEAQVMIKALVILLRNNVGKINQLLSWADEISKELPPQRIGKLVNLLESDLIFLELLKRDYLKWRGNIDSLFKMTGELYGDYRNFKKAFSRYSQYAPSVTQIADMSKQLKELLDSTNKLICNLNFQLHKFDNVDFETLKEILEDEGFKVRFWGRSEDEKKKDLKLFRSYPRLISGEGCK